MLDTLDNNATLADSSIIASPLSNANHSGPSVSAIQLSKIDEVIQNFQLSLYESTCHRMDVLEKSIESLNLEIQSLHSILKDFIQDRGVRPPISPNNSLASKDSAILSISRKSQPTKKALIKSQMDIPFIEFEDYNIGRNQRDGSRTNYDIKEIQFLGFPEPIKDAKLNNKRFSIFIKWRDSKGKLHQKNIRFGTVGRLEYIDHGDEIKRDTLIAKHHKTENILAPSFWTIHLLNNKKTLAEAFQDTKEMLSTKYKDGILY